MKVLILTCNKYANSHYEDDIILMQSFQKMGYEVDLKSWEAPCQYEDYSCAIIRSCWDYQKNLVDFIKQLEEIATNTRLYNPIEMVKWNADKTYLSDLRDIPVVPTLYLDQSWKIGKTLDDISAWINENNSRVIIKPSVSASGENTYLVDVSSREEAIEQMERYTGKIMEVGKTPMVQPFLSSVQTQGEKSILVIGTTPIKVVKKYPKSSGYLVHDHYGGRSEIENLTEEDRAFTDKILKFLKDKFGKAPLYMRIDTLADEQGRMLLLELELIEPGLYLSEIEDVADVFVRETVSLFS